MYTGRFSYETYFLYLLIGILSVLIIQTALKSKTNSGNRSLSIGKDQFFYMIFVVLFVLFAAIRKIDYLIGGMDALAYVNNFKTALSTKPFTNLSFFSEWLFQAYTYLVRLCTANENVYIVLNYLIIAVSYVVFIRKYATSTTSAIPFILLVFLYLRAFNTMRSSIAVAVFLFSLTIIDEHKIPAFLLALSSVFIHRMSIVFVMLIPFYHIFKRLIRRLNGGRLFCFSAVCITFSIIAASILQKNVRNFSFMSTTDLWYATTGRNVSLLSRWPMFIAQLLLLIVMVFFFGELEDSEVNAKLKVFCIFDFMVLPATIILGMWRANEYLYVARLIVWGNLIPIVSSKFKPSKFVKVVFFVLFIAWLTFRIYSEWDDMKVMPYIIRFLN